MVTLHKKKDFRLGLKRGLPIALGYIPVSFTFGLMAVNGGLSPWLAIFISMTNLTSAGQFAGTNLIIGGTGLLEITLTIFVINIRYMLMSLSLSQKISAKIPLLQRLIFAFGITDETFTVASMEEGLPNHSLSFEYLIGLVSTPFLGWTMGTALGAFICSALPLSLSSAMGIALYGMFIAIIVPPAKKSRPVLSIVIIAVAIMCILKYIPLFHFISSGFRIIIAAVVGAALGAILFPIENQKMMEDHNE